MGQNQNKKQKTLHLAQHMQLPAGLADVLLRPVRLADAAAHYEPAQVLELLV